MKFGIKNIFSSSETKGRDVLLTGIPRSGTTLACRLLSECPQVVALNEPMDRDKFPARAEALSAVDEAFRTFRKSLLRSGTALARTRDGRITDNAYDHSSGRRQRVVERTEIHFDKPLEAGFTLVLKHNAEFTLLLPEIAQGREVFAMIRNPLALLSSWSSVDVPVSRGKVAKSARLLPAFDSALEGIEGLLERQLFILSWYFGQYRGFPEANVLRYEELASSNGRLLERATQAPVPGHWDISEKNTNPLYDKESIQRAGEALLATEGHYWAFYTRADVEGLLNRLLQ